MSSPMNWAIKESTHKLLIYAITSNLLGKGKVLPCPDQDTAEKPIIEVNGHYASSLLPLSDGYLLHVRVGDHWEKGAVCKGKVSVEAGYTDDPRKAKSLRVGLERICEANPEAIGNAIKETMPYLNL